MAFSIDSLLSNAKEILQTYFKTTIKLADSTCLSTHEGCINSYRLTLKSASPVPQSVILKHFLPDNQDPEGQLIFERFCNEATCYTLLNKDLEQTLIPKYYGADNKFCFILIEDLGATHISLVDYLLSANKSNATQALDMFMRTLADFHAFSINKLDDFHSIFKKFSPHSASPSDKAQHILLDFTNKISAVLDSFGMLFNDKLQHEIALVINQLFQPGSFCTLAHGDICPDNVFICPAKNKLYLLDFEYTQPRSLFLDLTFLRMSMPTCWCAMSFPNDIINRLEKIYHDALIAKTALQFKQPIHQRNYTFACAYWMLKFLSYADNLVLEDKIWPSGKTPPNVTWDDKLNLMRPRFAIICSTFCNIAERYDLLPGLRDMTNSILDYTKTQWQCTQKLKLYPAFC